MKGRKGCLVCGKYHGTNKRHTKEEVSEAIHNLMPKYPNDYLTVKDLSNVVNMVKSTEEEEIK